MNTRERHRVFSGLFSGPLEKTYPPDGVTATILCLVCMCLFLFPDALESIASFLFDSHVTLKANASRFDFLLITPLIAIGYAWLNVVGTTSRLSRHINAALLLAAFVVMLSSLLTL